MAQVAAFSFDHIAIRINAFGRYERDELEALILFLREKKALKGACLDVGANIGNHSLFFANHFIEVHSFEPSPSTFALLKINSMLRSNIHCYNFGISDSIRDAFWSAPMHNLGEGAIVCGSLPGVTRQGIAVRLADIDSLAEIQGVEIGLIKIDVEGQEAEVLDGARATISANSPVIVFEQQENEIRSGSSPSIDRLRSLGYCNFYMFRRSPTSPWAITTVMLRLLFGERCSFVPVHKFETVFYSMIVATK